MNCSEKTSCSVCGNLTRRIISHDDEAYDVCANCGEDWTDTIYGTHTDFDTWEDIHFPFYPSYNKYNYDYEFI